MAEITIRNHFDANDIVKIIERHRILYKEEFGYSNEFGDYVENSLKGDIDCIWIAELDGTFAGCIGVVRANEYSVQLRKFLVEPEMRGHGLGKRLMKCLLDYCMGKNYTKVFLWTVSELLAARKLYEEFGFTLIESKPKQLLWGKELIQERWDLSLNPNR